MGVEIEGDEVGLRDGAACVGLLVGVKEGNLVGDTDGIIVG